MDSSDSLFRSLEIDHKRRMTHMAAAARCQLRSRPSHTPQVGEGGAPVVPIQDTQDVTMLFGLYQIQASQTHSQDAEAIQAPMSTDHNAPFIHSRFLQDDDEYLSINQHTGTCYNCFQGGHLAQDCPSNPKFHMFMKLAPELRERIYEFALASDRTIKPHLCDNALKFHDDNQLDHGATDAMLDITRVSKQVRSESLPIFYSANTFVLSQDTPTYFDRLQHLGRFHMIRHVRFNIGMRRENTVALTLRGMKQYIKAADAYEKKIHRAKAIANGWSVPVDDDWWLKTFTRTETTKPSAPDCADVVGESFSSLTNHPQYLAGGLSELNVFIALRKLTSTFNSTDCPQKLVIPVPRAQIFTEYDSLKWFPTVARGLGIHLHFVEGVDLDPSGRGFITVTWHQKYQKKDFATVGNDTSTMATSIAAEEVERCALKLFPDLESMPRTRGTTYYRSSCSNDHVRWYHVPTEGGGIRG